MSRNKLHNKFDPSWCFMDVGLRWIYVSGICGAGALFFSTLLFICCYTMMLVKGQAGQKSTFRLWKTAENGGIKQFQGYGDSKFIIDWANHLSSIENLGLHEPSSRGQKMF